MTLGEACVKAERLMRKIPVEFQPDVVRYLADHFGRKLSDYERVKRWRYHQKIRGVITNGDNADVSHAPSISPVFSEVVPSEVVRGEVPETKELHVKQERQEPVGFQVFWQAYPKRIGKGKARESWLKNRCESRTNLIVNAIETQREYLLREGGKYVPNPATWLNERRWEDEPPSVPTPGDERTKRNVAGVAEWLRQQQEAP